MPEPQHPLERYTDRLASEMGQAIDKLATYLRPPGGRVLWTTPLARKDALAFYRQHKNDEIGKAALAGLSPLDVMDLERNLALDEQGEEEGFG